MTDQISSLDETLAVLQADREARKFDGERFEAAVLQHAGEIPSWEIAKCWRYLEWPDRTTVGVPLPPQDAGIDLVAVKHGGSHIAIQCKARSGGGSVTTKQIQQFAGAAPASVFAERWMVAEAHRSAATEDAAAVAAVTFVDFEAALADALEDAREQAATEPDPRTAMQQEAVAACVQALRAGLPVALLLDGVHIGEHCLVVALGIAADGQKHALDLWEGATENAAVCQSFLATLQSRGLRTDRSLLVILDGALALHKAVRAVFGEAALIQRCQVHKLRNILDHLCQGRSKIRPPWRRKTRPSGRGVAWLKATVRRAYQASDVKTATRLLTDLAKRLEDEYPSAAGSVREGAGRNADRAHAAPLDPPAAVARHDQRRRESAESHPPREAPRETVAWGTDDAAVGGCWCPRSRQGLPAPEGMRRYAAFGQRASRTRPTTGARCLRRERRVESHPSRRRVSTAVGTSPRGLLDQGCACRTSFMLAVLNGSGQKKRLDSDVKMMGVMMVASQHQPFLLSFLA